MKHDDDMFNFAMAMLWYAIVSTAAATIVSYLIFG